MKYFTTRKIGEYEIITGFGQAPIDPEMTKQKIEPMLKESKEWEALFNLGQKKFALMQQLSKSKSPKYEQLQQNLFTVETDLLSADQEFLKKRKELYQEHAVYAQPADGILINSDIRKEVYKKFINKKNGYVTSSGDFVSKEEVEKSYIASLTKEEKNNRTQHELAKALSESVTLKNELEVTGDPDAVKKSMDYYNEKKKTIEEKYGG